MALSEKQLRAVKESNERINILCGSVRSGKSLATQFKLLKMVRELPPGIIIISGYSNDSIERNVINEAIDLFGSDARYQPGNQVLYLFGRKIHIIGANNERALFKIQGMTIVGALIDELTTIPQSFFMMLLSRLTHDDAQVIASCNPDNPYHWVKRDFIDKAQDAGVKVFNFRFEDNPSLSEKYIDGLKKLYTGMWYKRYILGEWCMAEGAIYDFFDEKIHTIYRPPSYAKYYIVGLDYGTRNPFGAVMIGFNDDVQPSVWVEREYYFDSKKEGYQKTDAEYARDIQRFLSDYPIRRLYVDPSAASLKLELKRAMPRLSIGDAINDVLPGIATVSTLMTTGQLRIMESCNHLIEELHAYVWDEKAAQRGLDEPKKQSDHLCDALRYAIYSHYGNKKSLKEKSKEERELEMLKKVSARDQLDSGWGHGWKPIG